jgi:SAM-dependent methyltransferase
VDNWDAHWQAYERMARSNPAQAYRRRLILSWLRGARPAEGPWRILDAGSGQGELAFKIRRAFPQAGILGIDQSRTGVEMSRAKVPGAVFLEQDLTREQEPPPELRRWATHAVCSEVLEHVERPETVLRGIKPYLAAGGRLMLTVPGGPMNQYEKHIGHRRHFRLDDVRCLLENEGFRVLSLQGAGFPFFNLYKMVSLARGKAILCDAPSPSGRQGLAARAALALFAALFRLNLPATRLGWQRVAVAQLGDAPGRT